MTEIGDILVLKPIMAGALIPGSVYGFHTDTRGFRTMQADAAVYMGGADDLTDSIIFELQDSPPPTIGGGMKFNPKLDGDPILGKSPADTREVFIPFTPAVNCTAFRISLWLSRRGAPQPEGINPVAKIRARVWNDSLGLPNNIIGSPGLWVAPLNILNSPTKIDFILDTANINLTAGTPYWLALDLSLIDNDTMNWIRVHCKDVAGTSGCQVNQGGAYAARANQEPWFEFAYMQYTPIGVGVITYIASEFIGDFIIKRKEVNLELFNDFLRVKATVDAGSWWLAAYLAIVGGPLSSPPNDCFIVNMQGG